MNKGKSFGIVVSFALFALSVSGCAETETVWQPLADNTLRIALLESDKEYDASFLNAVDFASDKFTAETGIPMEIVVYEDNYMYNTAIANARNIAADADIDAVIIRQDTDLVDFSAEILNEAKKPVICAGRCYERTIDGGYEHFLVDTINAKATGALIADYAHSKGYKRIAFCRSDTEYETEVLRGFNITVTDNYSNEMYLADTVIGPYTSDDLWDACRRWELLGVDAVCISNSEILNSQIVRGVRENGYDLPFICDTGVNTADDIEMNGGYLDGVVIVGGYYHGDERNEEVFSAFAEKFGYEMSYDEVKAYDLVFMMGKNLISSEGTPADFIAGIKYGEDNRGLTGLITYGERGSLVPSGNEIMIFRDGRFRYLKGEDDNG